MKVLFDQFVKERIYLKALLTNSEKWGKRKILVVSKNSLRVL